jgi:Barstar (barnase inhibitor)
VAVLDPLRSADPPWVHRVVLPPGKKAGSVLAAPPGFVVRAIDGRRCRTKRGLFSEFARALEFPGDSGRNWDAFEELLADLAWLPGKGYLLIVTDADQLLVDLSEDYDTFIEIAQSVAKEWAAPRRGESPRPAVPFHVCLAIPRGRESARADWRVPRLDTERRTG